MLSIVWLKVRKDKIHVKNKLETKCYSLKMSIDKISKNLKFLKWKSNLFK